MRRSTWMFAVIAVAVLLPIRDSNGTTFPLTRFESANYSVHGSGHTFFSYDAFQPNLQGFHWEIERVVIYVTQTITLQVNTPPNFQPRPPFGFPGPTPYNFAFRVEQEFDPLGSIYPAGFRTLTPVTSTVYGLASGAGGVASATTSFNYTLVFDEGSDLAGGLEVASSALFQAEREDFLPTSFSDDIYAFSRLSATRLYGLSASVLTYSGFTNMLIQYDGNLFLEEGQEPPAFLFQVPTALPLPMLLAGFSAIFLIRRRTRTPR